MAAGFVLLIIALILLFDFLNGYLDSASLVATVISSGSLSPQWALVLAAVCEFFGAMYLGTRVARTIAFSLVDQAAMRQYGDGSLIIIASLVSASIWMFFLFFKGYPCSSSHTLLGSLIGPFLVGPGAHAVEWGNICLLLGVLFTAPIVGFAASFYLTKTTQYIFSRSAPRINKHFRYLQILSSLGLALFHGSNDGQKNMGFAVFALSAAGYMGGFTPGGDFPAWIVLMISAGIALGVFMGGWRVLRTLGMRLYRVRPLHGFCGQTTSLCLVSAATAWGFPVSTTHITSSSIIGAGCATKIKSVRWGIIGQISLFWVITIPATACLSAVIFMLLKILTGRHG